MRTPVFIVCSPHERAGKTLLARMIAEFFISGGAEIECFDLGAEEPSLVDYLPACTTLATVSDTRGQMALFDQLVRDDTVPKVVDLGARLFDQFFTVMAQVGLGEEARRRDIQVVVLFIVTPGPGAARAYATLQRWLPGIVLIPVYNEVFGRGVRRDEYPTVGGASLPLRIPVLAAGLNRIITHPGFSFSDFRSGLLRDIAGGYQAELESWVKRVVVEFRELELRLLLATLRLSLSL